MRIAILGEPGQTVRATLAARAADRPASSSAAGDCLLVWDGAAAETLAAIDAEPSLGWVHLRSAGVPAPVPAACEERGLILTNGSGAQANAIAEYVVCALLGLCKRVPELIEAQRQRHWRPELGGTELHGQTIGILGVGAVGRACARLLGPFGVQLIGVRRSAGAVPGIAEVHSSPELSAVLPRLDALVITAPLTEATRGMIGRAELSRLRPGAVLVNVGRGAIVDQGALVDALRANHLAGAALDVFTEEPLPSSSSLWSLPNVMISPHCVDDTPQTAQRGLDLFLENLERWLAGRPLANLVDAEIGY